MKKNFLFIMAATVTVVLMINYAHAQVAMNRTSAAGAGFTFSHNSAGKTVATNNVSIHALKDFSKRFSSTTGTAWYENANGFIAKFSSAEEQTSVVYQKKGKWIYTICQYSEKNLPQQVRTLVKSTYYDYTILIIEAIEVPDNENKIFLVHLYDATSIKTVRVCNNEMSIISDYKRG